MRRFFRTAVGKTVLFMLTMVAGTAAVASVVGIAFMAEVNMYSRTQQQVYDEIIENMMIQDGRRILENHLFADGAGNLDMGNLEYEFLDEQQNVLAASEEKDTSWDYSYYYRVETDGESFDYFYDSEGKEKAEAARRAASTVNQKDTKNSVGSELAEEDPGAKSSEPEAASSELAEEDQESEQSESETVSSELAGEDFAPEEEKSQNEDTWGEVTWYTLNCSLKAELPEEEENYELYDFAEDEFEPDYREIYTYIDEEDGVGKVQIAAPRKEAIDAALAKIKAIVAIPEVGEIYHGTVRSVMPYGCFVEFLPGKDGLLHISEIDWKRLETVEEAGIKEGDPIDVKLIEIHAKTGKFKLSRRVLIEKPADYQERPARERRPRPERPERGERRPRREERQHDAAPKQDKQESSDFKSALDDLI